MTTSGWSNMTVRPATDQFLKVEPLDDDDPTGSVWVRWSGGESSSTLVLVLEPRQLDQLVDVLATYRNRYLTPALADQLLGPDPVHAHIRCADCGEVGERTGHMGCQYPGLRDRTR